GASTTAGARRARSRRRCGARGRGRQTRWRPSVRSRTRPPRARRSARLAATSAPPAPSRPARPLRPVLSPPPLPTRLRTLQLPAVGEHEGEPGLGLVVEARVVLGRVVGEGGDSLRDGPAAGTFPCRIVGRQCLAKG